jgi:periplasmic copper chaperone A
MRIAITVAVLLAMLAGPAGANTKAVVAGDAWSRPATGIGVAYLTISNRAGTADRLVGAASPVARSVEIHESTESMKPMGAMTAMTGRGIASMHRVAFVPIGAHSREKLAPGGYHIMLIGLRHDLHADQTFPLRLHFAHAGWVEVSVHVQPI